MNYFLLFLQSFGLELLLLVVFNLRPRGRVLRVALLANALTHPWVVFGFLAWPGGNLLASLLAAELFAVLAEAWIFHRHLELSPGRALGLSLLANLLSWEISPRLSYYGHHGHLF